MRRPSISQRRTCPLALSSTLIWITPIARPNLSLRMTSGSCLLRRRRRHKGGRTRRGRSVRPPRRSSRSTAEKLGGASLRRVSAASSLLRPLRFLPHRASPTTARGSCLRRRWRLQVFARRWGRSAEVTAVSAWTLRCLWIARTRAVPSCELAVPVLAPARFESSVHRPARQACDSVNTYNIYSVISSQATPATCLKLHVPLQQLPRATPLASCRS